MWNTFFNINLFFFFHIQSLFLLLMNRLWSAARPRHDQSIAKREKRRPIMQPNPSTTLTSSPNPAFVLDDRDGLLSVQSVPDKVQVASCGRAFQHQIASILPVWHTTDSNIPTPVYMHVYPQMYSHLRKHCSTSLVLTCNLPSSVFLLGRTTEIIYGL